MEHKMTGKSASIIAASLLAIIFIGIFLLKLEPHIPLVIAIVLLTFAGKMLNIRNGLMEKGFKDGVMTGLIPIMILSLIGMLIGVWMLSGTVPTLLTLGFSFVTPEWYLISALFLTLLVSTFTGSSFTTIGTIGVALIGLAAVLGISPALAAGAIISGAVFGDKMSPLSDTTNFASAVAEVNIIEHIKHMLWTTLPALLLTAIFFLWFGNQENASVDLSALKSAQAALEANFNLSVWTLVSPALVLIFVMRRVPVMTSLVTGIAAAIVTAMLFQKGVTLQDSLTVLQRGFSLETSNDLINQIVNRGGLQSMMWSISLVIIALGFGGMLQAMGVVSALISSLTAIIKRNGDLTVTAALSAIGVNLLTGEQYLSILLPGQTYKQLYQERNLPAKSLSRTLEDAGTLVNPLVPWGVSGAFFASTLGVPVLEYAPYALFLYLSPIFTILLGYTDGRILSKLLPASSRKMTEN